MKEKGLRMLLRVETREMFLKFSRFDFCFHSSRDDVNKVIPTKGWNNISTKLILRWQIFTGFHRKHWHLYPSSRNAGYIRKD
jgi:hypothetical protein